MRYEPPKPGEVRICPSCGTRNKARMARCAACAEALGTIPPQARAAVWRPMPPSRMPRGTRIALAVGTVLALLTGLYLRQTFRASLDLGEVRADSTVEAPPPAEVAAEPIPDSELTYQPFARGTNAPIMPPPGHVEGVAPMPEREAAAVGDSGMVSITPSDARRKVLGSGRRTFTNDDLDALRAAEPMTPPVPAAPPPTMPDGSPAPSGN
jgi:hypothetical protein